MDKDRCLAAFEEVQEKAGFRLPPWLSFRRKAAITRFAQLGFPTLKDEEWKYTSVEPIVKSSFRFPFEVRGNGLSIDKIKPFLFFERGSRLVFVNGRFWKEASCLSPAFSEGAAASLQEALELRTDSLESYLAKEAGNENNAFSALNAAFFSDGAFLSLPEGKVIEEPLELLFLSSARGEKVISQPRNLILLGEASQATVIEHHVSLEEDESFTNAVTEIDLGSGARLEHYQIQTGSGKNFHMATAQIAAKRDSGYRSRVFSFGARLSRNNLNVLLGAEGAQAELAGLYLARDEQHVDHHTVIDHTEPHGTSRQLYKGILRGKARAVFNGKIFVRKDAQKTDAHQLNQNLLLSEGAVVDTKPQLEISADDVKCTHGAAVGQLAEEEIFYAKTRGLSDEGARGLLVYGFASEVLNSVALERVREKLDQVIWKFLGEAPL